MMQQDTSQQADALKPAKRTAILSARLLGFGGLIPFVVLAGATLLELRTPFAPASAYLIGYGAIILSFVGALHWGAQLSKDEPLAARFIFSVVPALIGWLALMMPPFAAASALIAGLVMCWAHDMRLVAKKEWPSYMGGLRTILTAIACLSLMMVIVPHFS